MAGLSMALGTEHVYVDATAPLAAREAARMRIKYKLMSVLAVAALTSGSTVALALPAAADACSVDSDTCTVGQAAQTPRAS